MVAWVGSVGVEERQVLNIEKVCFALPEGHVERFKHRIHFSGGGVIKRSPDIVTARTRELPRPFLAPLVITCQMVGRGQ